jgi:hypothetical protein
MEDFNDPPRLDVDLGHPEPQLRKEANTATF